MKKEDVNRFDNLYDNQLRSLKTTIISSPLAPMTLITGALSRPSVTSV
jgi:hypothetical protein